MRDKKQLDENISRIVRCIERNVPPAVEARIREASEVIRPRPRFSGGRWRPARILSRRGMKILALAPGAAAIVALGALLLVPALRKSPAPKISEIRTEFEIADKNIKIVFIQRPDFKLTQEE